jgi:carbonic anhydrase
MSTRRHFILAGASALAVGAAGNARADDDQCAIFTTTRQSAITPDGALERLKQGNARFVAGKSVHCDLMAQVRATADAQAPFAAIVGCMDSRTAPELVFDQQIGDIFVTRIAGNFVNTDIIGSLEFATRLAGAKAIVILAHSNCGAVKGAIDRVELGNLTHTLANIRPAVEKVAKRDGAHTSKDAQFVQSVIEQNARDAADQLRARSAVLRELVAAGSLTIAAAEHDLSTGKVSWLT